MDCQSIEIKVDGNKGSNSRGVEGVKMTFTERVAEIVELRYGNNQTAEQAAFKIMAMVEKVGEEYIKELETRLLIVGIKEFMRRLGI